MSDNVKTHAIASILAGLVATTVCSPVGVIKTRVMSASPVDHGGLLGLLKDQYRREGFTWVFRG
jgi:solute carrier family 25 (mitochondrial dicarboxylate transporter), member 10